MKLTPDQIAFIHRGLCEAGYTASADALVEHIRDLEREHERSLTHWVDKCSRLDAERNRLRGALEKVAGMNPGMCGGYVETDCEKCEDMITICASAIGKDVKE